jgi:hypothetical protein
MTVGLPGPDRLPTALERRVAVAEGDRVPIVAIARGKDWRAGRPDLGIGDLLVPCAQKPGVQVILGGLTN